MPNQGVSIWKRHPGLFEWVAELRRGGASNREIARMATERVGETVTEPTIQGKMRNHGIVPEFAEVPRELVEPKNGYAKPYIAPKPTYATGWEPRVEIKDGKATAVSTATEIENPDHSWLIEGWKLDPTRWRIVGTLGVNRWTTPVPIRSAAGCKCTPKIDDAHYEERWNYQYKAQLEEIDPVREAALEQLLEEIRTHVPIPFAPPTGDEATFVAIADAQIGKGDQGGTPRAITNFYRGIDGFEERVSMLRAHGKCRGTLYIAGMGDLIENCADFYAQQTFRTDRNLRDQIKIARRLILKAIERWAPLFDRVVIAAVGGNHGENRKDGKSYTDFGDNHDLAIFDMLEEILDANRAAYGHVSFVIPKDDPTVTLDMHGVGVGLTHGQVIRGNRGKGPKVEQASQIAQNAINWWAAQAHGQRPIGGARMLFTAHNHHLLMTETGGGKTHWQCCALEPGSDWYTYQSGNSSRAGMLTMRIGENVSESGWADPEVV